MQTQSPRFRALIIPLVFALSCVVLILMVWRAFGGALPLQPTGYRVNVPLPQASNLFPGGDVRISGINVGRVVGVERRGNAALVEVDLNPRFAPLRQQATAVLRTKTLLGEAYLAIAPGPRSAPPIPEYGTLSRAQVTPAQRLDDVLETFAPKTRRDLRTMLGGLAGALRGRAPELNATLGRAAPLSEDLDTLFTLLDGQRPQLRQLIASSGDVLEAASARDDDLRGAIVATGRVLQTTGRRDEALAGTVRALPPFLGELRRTSGRLESAAGDLDAATIALDGPAQRLDGALQAVDTAAPTFRELFDRLPGVLRSSERGLPALTSILREASPALDRVYPALRQVIPLLQLLGESRRSVVGTFANVGQIQNGTMIGPGGRTIHYGNGLPTFWNETVGGWIKRLPSNRQNPYPKPDSALDIGRGGLKAYDCRNVNNVNYLAPFGGTPDCLTQGPWTFNGVNATFPRLTEAPP